MVPIITRISEKKLIGMRIKMSHSDYRIGELWAGFMPRRKEISNHLSGELISLAVYPPAFFEQYSPSRPFERWAAVEVSDFNQVPGEMDTYILPGGLYAVFQFRGTDAGMAGFYQHIFEVWLPGSEYVLDDKAHFEILGEKYKRNDPDSEEEIWIPVRGK